MKTKEILTYDFMNIIAITFIAVCVLGSMDDSTVVVADFLAVVVVTFLIPGVLLHVHWGVDCVGGVGGVGGKSNGFAFDRSNLEVDMWCGRGSGALAGLGAGGWWGWSVEGGRGGWGCTAAAAALWARRAILCQPFHLQLLGDGKKRVKLFLGDVDFAMVHEIQHGHQLLVLDAFQVEQRMLVPVPPKNCLEEGGAGGEDDLVRLQLVVLAGEGHVEEILVLSKLLESWTYVRLEVIPPQTKLVCWGRHGWQWSHWVPVFAEAQSSKLESEERRWRQPVGQNTALFPLDGQTRLACSALIGCDKSFK